MPTISLTHEQLELLLSIVKNEEEGAIDNLEDLELNDPGNTADAREHYGNVQELVTLVAEAA